MNSAHLRRSAVTWVAAYAVALQVLLAAFAPFAPIFAVGFHATLCTHDAHRSDTPVRDEHRCAAICAAMGQGVSALTPPETFAVLDDSQAVPARATAADRSAPLQELRGPQVPRGPPRA
jgi:hypothetical protein